MITDNEKNFIKSIEEYKIKAHDALLYIREHYNVVCEIDDNCRFNFNINETNSKLNIIAAKKYLSENLNSDFLRTNIDNL